MGKIYRGLISGGELSLTFIDSSDISVRARELHCLGNAAGDALGRTLTVTAYMSCAFKSEGERVSVTVKGENCRITACGEFDNSVRGYIDMTCEAAASAEELIGSSGRITVVRDLGLKEPYSGSCALVKGNIEDDFSAYFTYSDQQPTIVVLFDGAGGIGAGGAFISAMPGCGANGLSLAVEIANRLYKMRGESSVFNTQAAIEEFFEKSEFCEIKTAFRCNCSREYVERALLSMGRGELRSAINEQGEIQVVCPFCNEKYRFTRQDISELLGDI